MQEIMIQIIIQLIDDNANIKFFGVSWGIFSQKINTIDYSNFIKSINSKKKVNQFFILLVSKQQKDKKWHMQIKMEKNGERL